ncbi:MAG: Hsp33 family molecular chaperone HslO [Lachnospiraceae bacterium]|nr:Hsp33 family molecular chaperone HslO [Lachnospiraceae bacterium]
MPNKDYMVRATAADEQIRAFAATTRELAEQARVIHGMSPVASAALGRLMTAGLMMGSMMKGEDDLLTLKINGDGPMRGILVTANAHAQVKGYVYEPEVLLPANALGKLDVGGAVGKGTLSVIKDLGLKEPYIGQTALVSGEIAEDLTYYFAASEQVPSSVALGVLMNRDNTVRCAGGFIIQLMPGTKEEVVAALEERLSGIRSVTAMLNAGMMPEQILSELLGDMGLRVNEKQPVSYHCDCSRERVGRAILSIGRTGLEKMIADGKPVEAGCQFCGKKYQFAVNEIGEMLEQAR